MADVESKSSDNILYDLSVVTDWKFENELFMSVQIVRPQDRPTLVIGCVATKETRTNKEKVNKSFIGRTSSLVRRTTWTLLRSIGIPLKSPTPCLLPEHIVRWKNSQNGWRIAVSSSGNYFAVAQESCVEIRQLQDGLETLTGKGTLPPDPYPQWRCMAWSADETMVASSRSCGTIDVFNIMGMLLFTIPGTLIDDSTPLDLSHSVAALVFTDFKPKQGEWSAELLVISYSGSMTSYFVDRDNGYQQRYRFVFATEYPRGVAAVAYDANHKILFVGGMGFNDSTYPSVARREGITAWRILSDAPYCKLVTDYEEDKRMATTKAPLLCRLSSMVQFRNVPVDGIVHLSLSSSCKTLVSLHNSGKLSVWDVPSLRPRKQYPLTDQPDWEELSPDFHDIPAKKKRLKDLIPHRHLIDVNFWSDELLILARCTGAVTVASPDDLKNLLGKSPEWFEPSPELTQAHNGAFLGLECEIIFPKKRIMMTSADGNDDFEESDEEDSSLFARSSRMSKQVLYYLTDSHTFEPAKRKPRYVTKIQRVVMLRSTTPEELYARKIEDEEYGEALLLAQAFKLDCDLVYQRQWRKSAVSYASIQDYLSKIGKRSWVMHECLERVTDNLDAMKELLEYGLHGTDLPALVAIGKGEDGGRFILCDPDDGLYDETYDEFDPKSMSLKEEKRAEIQQEWLDQVDFENLNLEQKELCRARHKFLQYLDRLKTYECILGGPNAASERFNVAFYSAFRSRSIYDIAAEYAQDDDWNALETLLTFHNSDLAPHRLAILSNFPETSYPSDYKSLLPEIGEDEVEPWEVDVWREQDWVEKAECWKNVALDTDDESKFLYANFNVKYRTSKLSPDLVQDWYHERVHEIEAKSRLVDYAIELVRLGIEKGVESLSDLLDDLLTMEMLAYDCGVDNSISFSSLEQMADYDRLELIMSKSSKEMYTKHLHQWMLPFLQRCEQKESGSHNRLLRDYILTKARNDLSLVLKIFEASKVTMNPPVIQTHEELMSLALEAIYICKRDDQLDNVIKIVECLPIRNKDARKESNEMLKLHKQTDQLENHISAAKIFNRNGMTQTMASIKSSEIDPDVTRNLMVKLTRLASKRPIPLSEQDWHKLHDDVLELQTKVYKCISRSACHEIFVESLLCSGKQDTIRLAGQMLERSCTETKPNRSQRGSSMDKVSYSKAVDLTLSAAREYFDSSADLNDPCMDLARSCLHLIIDTPSPIQEELDLIAALPLLNEFGVSVLPLQVRLCKNRCDFVKTAVTTKPTSYKQTQRLLQLSQRLGIHFETNEEHEGFVYKMAAEAAVSAMDYDFAYQCCERLISLCHSPAWSVCVRLAEQEAFRNIDAKTKLLSFAVTYCSNDMIKPVLQARCLLETQVLYDQINKTVQEGKDQDADASNRESPFSARAAVQQTQQILSSTKRTTSAVLSTVADAKWWQSAVSSLKQPKRLEDDNKYMRKDDGNASVKKQGCHPFYSDIIEDCYEDWLSADYTSMNLHDNDPAIALSSKILRAAKLEEMLTDGSERKASNEALLEMAKQLLPRDAALGLAYLMALPESANVASIFEDIPSTDISLQLALYYHSLNLYRVVKPCYADHVSPLYRHGPSKTMQRVVDYVLHSPKDSRPQEIEPIANNVKNYHEMLEDYKQACTLQNLGKGVDVVRFADDPDYKRETIFGLAMSLELDVYNIAISLAKRYSLPLWDVYMCHLECLFSDCKSMKEVENRVSKLDILPTLKSKGKEFTSRMMTRVYPLLAGTDLAGLTFFFSLVDGDEDKIMNGMSPGEHFRLLKKLKGVCPSLDYKHLIESEVPPATVLKEHLSANNINALVKLAPQIPDKNGGFLQPSALHSSWASHKFWTNDEGKVMPDSDSGWVHRYEALAEFVQKLLPEDLLQLVDNLVFTEAVRDKLTIPCREEIVNRALKYSRLSVGGKKKKQNDTGEMKWDECSASLQLRYKHIKSLTNDTIQSFAVGENPVFSSYATKYDLSKGVLSQIELLLVQMILDGQAIELIEDVLTVSPPSSLTARTILQQAVRHISGALRGSPVADEISVTGSWLSALEMVVENVREHQDNGGDLVQQEDVMSLLRSFCSDSTIEVAPRLDVLQVLEKSFDLSEADRVLLTLYRTNALVSSTWTNIQVIEENVTTEGCRLDLFSQLLGHSSEKEHFINLSRILVLWPQFSPERSRVSKENPWVRVFSAIIESQDSLSGTIVDEILRDVCTIFPMDSKCSKHVADLLTAHGQHVSSIKLLFTCPDDGLTEEALQLLSQQTRNVEDPELLKLILTKGATASVVAMPVYPCLIEFVLENQEDGHMRDVGSPKVVAAQLEKAEFQAEAGSVLLRAQSSHSMLQSFSAALSSVSHWLKK